MDAKKIIVVGAGISGLTAAVYLQRSGCDVTVLEKHVIPGGLSTSWTRKGFFFEGGMHWLTGSSPKLLLNRVWHESGALKENNPITNRDPIYTLVDGDKSINLWRDVKKLKADLLAYAPEDKKAINRLCRDVKIMSTVHLPIMDLPGLKTSRHCNEPLWNLIKMAPAGLRYGSLAKQTYEEYVNKFTNKNVRHLLMSIIGYRYNALSLVYTIAAFASGDCGFPEGGSLRMAQNLADTFTKLGGKIQYNTTVEKVVVENAKTKGVMVKGSLLPSDAVLVAFDTRTAVDTMFIPPLEEKWVYAMRKKVVSEQNMFFGLGIKANLSKYPFGMVIPFDTPFEAGGNTFNEIRINNYAGKPGYAPDGCSTVTCLLLCGCYDWWKAKKADGTYKDEKEKLLDRFIAMLERYIPEVKGTVIARDLATPCTYERYTASFEGSWMSVWRPGDSSFVFPSKSKSVKGLYFASERNQMPGGLPICAWAGRKAAQTVCRDWKLTFMCEDKQKHE